MQRVVHGAVEVQVRDVGRLVVVAVHGLLHLPQPRVHPPEVLSVALSAISGASWVSSAVRASITSPIVAPERISRPTIALPNVSSEGGATTVP